MFLRSKLGKLRERVTILWCMHFIRFDLNTLGRTVLFLRHSQHGHPHGHDTGAIFMQIFIILFFMILPRTCTVEKKNNY